VLDRDVVTTKMAVIDRCLSRIQEVRGERREELLPIDVEDITALNLQRAVQAAIDLATHVVSAEGYGTPDSAAGVFTLLEQRGVIDQSLAGRLRKMVGFRNIAIHDYQAVDPDIIESILDRHLDDLRSLGTRITNFFRLFR